MTRLDWRGVFPMAAILLFAFAWSAPKLNADNLWLDELYSLSNMGVFSQPYSLPQVVDSLSEHSPNHVPLFFVLGAQWAHLVGWAPLPMRFLSLLLGLLFLAWTYRLAAEALHRKTALVSVLLLSASGFVTLYFHEIRMYSLLLLLAVIHAWLYWRLITREVASWRAWLCFVASAVALLYTHVFAVFLFLGLGLHHLIFAARIKRWYRVWFAWSLSACALLPYLPHYLRGALAERTIGALQQTALDVPQLAGGLATILVNGVGLLWLPLLALALLSTRRRQNAKAWRFLIVWAGLIVSLMLFNEAFPLIDRLRFRFFLVSMPFFAILCAHLLLTPARWKLVAAPFLLIWIAGGLHIRGLGDGWAFAGRNNFIVDMPPLHKYAEALQGKTRALDTVVGLSRSKWVDFPLRHGKSLADYYVNALLGLDHFFFVAQPEDGQGALDPGEFAAEHPYMLLVYEPAFKAVVDQELAATVEADYAACDILVDSEALFARRFVHKSLACDREYAPIHYENGIRILDRFGEYDSENGVVRLVTGWEVADEAQLDQYNVSIQLINAEWQNLRQAGDRHLFDGVLKWYAVEMSTADLPPGDYRAVVIVYDRESSRDKLTGSDLATGEVGPILPILHFTIDAPAATR